MLGTIVISLFALAGAAPAGPPSPTTPAAPAAPITQITPVPPVAPTTPVATFRPLKNVAQPAGTHVKTVVRAHGVQNYTCASTGKYVSTGARARLFDITASVPQLQDSTASKDAKPFTYATPLVGHTVGAHYFDMHEGQLSPVWAFGHTPQMQVRARVVEQVDAPVDAASNVMWLGLNATATGQYADFVIRSETLGGQSPSSCTATNQIISMPYEANYWFFASK